MSWADLPEPERDRLASSLSRKQLDVLILHLAGCGTRRISLMLGISRTTVRDHLDAALEAAAYRDREESIR